MCARFYLDSPQDLLADGKVACGLDIAIEWITGQLIILVISWQQSDIKQR